MEKSWDDLTADIRWEMEKTFGKTGAVPSFQMGIPYVPRTTLAVLHKGEEVTPAHRVRAEGGRGDIIIQRGAVRNIIMGNLSSDVDLEKIADLTADKLESKIISKMRRP
ncbi:hypothetical protein ES703_125587 [subsurface metagenome]